MRSARWNVREGTIEKRIAYFYYRGWELECHRSETSAQAFKEASVSELWRAANYRREPRVNNEWGVDNATAAPPIKELQTAIGKILHPFGWFAN